jgi:predicted deacylase
MNRISRAVLSATVSITIFAWSNAQADDSFTVGAIEASAGSKVSGYLEVPSGVDAGTRIPVTIVHGRQAGPVLALIAGTHGTEYPGILALQRLRQSLNPGALAGTVILVHIANPPSFRGRTVYFNPVDGKNLNRAFPGKADGTHSERIAFVITHEVIERADYLVDLHAGDGNEALMPYVYMPVTGNPGLDAAAKAMAIAFGLDHIVIDEAELVSSEPSVYIDRTALALGIPAITTETGQLGSDDERWIEMAESGIGNLLRHFGMLEGAVRPNEKIVWLYGYEVLRSPHTGFFKASVKPGERVTSNAVIGAVLDDFGNELTAIMAPFAGLVNYVLSTPPISADEPVAMISRIRDE